jgi:thioredoxin-related protein
MLRRNLLWGAAACILAGRSWARSALPEHFDPSRDAAADLAAAVSLAKSQGKRVLVEVGGEWCAWCHILDRFVSSNEEIRQLVDSHFIWLKVNYSPANKNEALLARWPKVKGYPHLFVLDDEGRLLHTQPTSELEAGKGYDRKKMIRFLRQYSGA